MRLHRFLSACVGATALAAVPAFAQTVDQAVIDGLRWRQVGPANMMGRVADVEGIPFPSRTFFVAGAAGGVWKTTNNGTTFRPVFDNYGVASLGDIAIAPSDTMVIYLGTGEPNSRNSISPGGGVFKSTDGGGSWAVSSLGLPNPNATDLVIDPMNPSTLYAGSGAVVFKSTDSGASWAEANVGLNDLSGLSGLVINPAAPANLFAGTFHNGVFKTTDSAASWTEANNGLTSQYLVSLAIDPAAPATLYAGTVGGVFKSVDAGDNWAAANVGLTSIAFALVIDPTTPGTLYAGTDHAGVFQSTDGGGSWSAINPGLAYTDVRYLAIDSATPGHLYAGTHSGGVWQFTVPYFADGFEPGDACSWSAAVGGGCP